MKEILEKKEKEKEKRCKEEKSITGRNTNMKIYLIRHGQTKGNSLQRYIGTTDEPLLPEVKNRLKLNNYPHVDIVITSPLLRCRETAEVIYPKREMIVYQDFRECDFGRFENKNWQELTDDTQYQEWLDSNGTISFPGGENPDMFRERSCTGFEKAVAECFRRGVHSAALVVHGGTIMSIMEKYVEPKRDFYQWHVQNGSGYEIDLESSYWTNEIKEIHEVRSIRAI